MTTKTENGSGDSTMDVIDVIESVERGDFVRFNDRVEPLTVERVQRDGTVKRIEVVGSRGGVYRLTARVGSEGGSLARVSGTNEYGVYKWETMTLNNVELVDTHRLERGNVYKDNTSTLNSDIYIVLTEEQTKGRGWDGVRIQIKDDEIINVQYTSFSPFHKKPDIHDGDIEYCGKIHKYYYDNERDNTFQVIDMSDNDDGTRRDVWVNYGNQSSEYHSYHLFIPTVTDRFEPISYNEMTF